jgi:hypothetical protein
MRTLLKRGCRALQLEIEFFGAQALVIGSLPVVYWVLKRFIRGDRAVGDLGLLCLSYAIVAVGVFIWKFIVVGKVMQEEREFTQTIESLDEREQEALASFALNRRYRDEMLYNVSTKTPFMGRNFTGWFIEAEYKLSIRKWAKSFKPE